IYTDITLVAFRKREIDGRNIIELSFKGASKRVVTPIFIKLSSIAQGDSKSMEVLTMHNMEKHKSIADSEIDDILATVRL
ncbi:MAG: hypothetical protein P0S94_01605, partial [Simkaniaceae bacterium]|nr:hypothetical protein [Simkaniaceae bacterium]